MRHEYEVVIIGGGPAGLSAALIAGRSLRRALIIDGGTPRNAAAPAMHSYLSRDGILPRDFRATAHAELAHYASVERLDGMVSDIRAVDGGFIADIVDGGTLSALKVVLAVGLIDQLPRIEGLAEHWGRGVHHCPFCDGFEHRGQRWGVLAEDVAMLDHARFLSGWADTMTVLTNGAEAPADKVAELQRLGIGVVTARIAKVVGGDGHSLIGIEFGDGRRESLESLWVRPEQRQSPLVRKLGLTLRDDGAIWRNEFGETSIPNLYAIGDCAAGPVQQAILAAADGARVMFAIGHNLMTAA